ncbi:MAG: hypothetical protein AAF922_10070 [Pseudomonadota bacterium]
MTTIFKGSTNGGANRFFVKDEKIMVAGADVKGRQEVDIGILEDVWGFDTVKDNGALESDFAAENIRVFQTQMGDWRVQLGPENVGGSFIFSFGDDDKFYKDVNANKIEAKLADSDINTDGEVSSKAEGAAMNFALFLEEMLEADAIKFIEDAGASVDIGNQVPGGDEIRNLDDALSQLNDNDVKVDFSVKFGGAGVGGSTSTDAFNSQGAAENFIDTVQLANGELGFLDEILV